MRFQIGRRTRSFGSGLTRYFGFMRSCIAVFGLVIVAAGCGRGYESENRGIVAELPSLDEVVLIEEDHHGFCSGDTCLFGTDRSGALLIYSVDTDLYTQEALVEAYRQGLPDWVPSIEEGCANADPSFCDEVIFASFTRGDARIGLSLDNWSGGQFELHVNARGGA